jgi:hypothetical protein
MAFLASLSRSRRALRTEMRKHICLSCQWAR